MMTKKFTLNVTPEARWGSQPALALGCVVARLVQEGGIAEVRLTRNSLIVVVATTEPPQTARVRLRAIVEQEIMAVAERVERVKQSMAEAPSEPVA